MYKRQNYNIIKQRIESFNSETLIAGTATISFWAKADTNRTINLYVYQNFGSGGSSTVTVVNGQAFNLTTSWAKYSYTFAMPSTSGKTIGTNDLLEFTFAQGTAAYTFSYADVQLEIAPQATPFSRAGGSIGGELALCQRYYQTPWLNLPYGYALPPGYYASTTAGIGIYSLLVVPRVAPTLSIVQGGVSVQGTSGTTSTITLNNYAYPNTTWNLTANGSSYTAWTPMQLVSSNTTTPLIIAASAEL